MLEDLAYQYIALSDGQLRLISYLLSIVGGVIAAFTAPSGGWRLRRAPYFAASAGGFALISVQQLVWLGADGAVAAGTLWLLMTSDAMTALITGYMIAVVAMARSVDAFGTARKAYMAFVPLVNLYLLFTPSIDDNAAAATRTARLSRAAAGVTAGIALLAVGLVVTARMEQHMQIPMSDESVAKVAPTVVQQMIADGGLPATLQEVARQGRQGLPIEVDQYTTLVDITAADGVLYRDFRIEGVDVRQLTPEWRRNIGASICDYRPLRTLVDAGAVVAERYTHAEHGRIGAERVARTDCSA